MKRVGELPYQRKRQLKKNPTASEIKLRKILTDLGLSPAFQKVVFTPKMFYILDFLVHIPPRTIIELDGSSHDGREEYDRQREVDVLATKTYKKKKWVFFRLKNEQVWNGEAERLLRERWATFLARQERKKIRRQKSCA